MPLVVLLGPKQFAERRGERLPMKATADISNSASGGWSPSQADPTGFQA